MTEIIGVHFKKSGRMMFFYPQGEKIRVNDLVIVETDRGTEYGQVTLANIDCDPKALPEDITPILRLATEEDRRRIEENKKMAEEALAVCIQKVEESDLQMKVVGAEYTFDRTVLLFYFTANKRVDFRKLVRELAQNYHTRIELRQIGIRDQAKTLGGIGPCGQEICCRRYMCHFMPVSIKMAKTQGLSLNPTKISGLCGRLMCCLNYEQDHYEANTKKVPRKGTLILTEDGQGHVVDRDVLQSRVRARIHKADGSEDEKYYDVDAIEILEKRKKGSPRPQLWTNIEEHVFISEGEKKARLFQEEEANREGLIEEEESESGEDEDFLEEEGPCCPCCVKEKEEGAFSPLPEAALIIEEEDEEDEEDEVNEVDEEEEKKEEENSSFSLEEPDPSYEKPYGLKGRGKPRIRRGRRPPRKR